MSVDKHCKIGKVTHKKSGLVVHRGFGVNKHLVDILRHELSLAESGEIASISFVTLDRSGMGRYGRSVGDGHSIPDLFLATQILLGTFSA